MEEKKIKEYPIDFNLINGIDTQYYQTKRTKATVKTTIMVKKEDYDNLQQQLQLKDKEIEKLNKMIELMCNEWYEFCYDFTKRVKETREKFEQQALAELEKLRENK